MGKENSISYICESLNQCVEADWSWYEISKDFFPTIATLAVAFFSIRFAILQIKQQHQNSLDLQASERRKEIQLKLFEEIQEKLDGCASVAEAFGTDYLVKATFIKNGLDIPHDEGEFILKLRQVLEAITVVTIYIEHREIISPKLFRVARSAMHSAHHDLMEAMKDTSLDQRERYTAASKASGNASSYCTDLNACLQNEAFGDLFDNRAPVREPLDPNEKVITNDEVVLDELLRYFEHETPYGQQMDQVKADVARQYEDPTAT